MLSRLLQLCCVPFYRLHFHHCHVLYTTTISPFNDRLPVEPIPRCILPPLVSEDNLAVEKWHTQVFTVFPKSKPREGNHSYSWRKSVDQRSDTIIQLKGSVQQPDNFHFYSFGKTQLKFSIAEKAIFVTNIRKKHSNLISVESYDHGEHTTVNAF